MTEDKLKDLAHKIVENCFCRHPDSPTFLDGAELAFRICVQGGHGMFDLAEIWSVAVAKNFHHMEQKEDWDDDDDEDEQDPGLPD